jgi:hypothetical protein
MTAHPAWGRHRAGVRLAPLTIDRRELRDEDVAIDIAFAGSATPTSTPRATTGGAPAIPSCPARDRRHGARRSGPR